MFPCMFCCSVSMFFFLVFCSTCEIHSRAGCFSYPLSFLSICTVVLSPALHKKKKKKNLPEAGGTVIKEAVLLRRGPSLKARPFHCTWIGLTLVITPNVFHWHSVWRLWSDWQFRWLFYQGWMRFDRCVLASVGRLLVAWQEFWSESCSQWWEV